MNLSLLDLRDSCLMCKLIRLDRLNTKNTLNIYALRIEIQVIKIRHVGRTFKNTPRDNKSLTISYRASLHKMGLSANLNI